MVTEDIVAHVREWAIEKIHESSDVNVRNAESISEEFYEWIYIDDGGQELEIMSIDKYD